MVTQGERAAKDGSARILLGLRPVFGNVDVWSGSYTVIGGNSIAAAACCCPSKLRWRR